MLTGKRIEEAPNLHITAAFHRDPLGNPPPMRVRTTVVYPDRVKKKKERISASVTKQNKTSSIVESTRSTSRRFNGELF